jgi:hypothetical protein
MTEYEAVTETTKTNAEQLSQVRITNVNNAGEITVSSRSQSPIERLPDASVPVRRRVLWPEWTDKLGRNA